MNKYNNAQCFITKPTIYNSQSRKYHVYEAIIFSVEVVNIKGMEKTETFPLTTFTLVPIMCTINNNLMIDFGYPHGVNGLF